MLVRLENEKYVHISNSIKEFIIDEKIIIYMLLLMVVNYLILLFMVKRIVTI